VASILSLSYNANGAGLAQNWSLLKEITFLVDVADQNGTAIIELFANSTFSGSSFASHTTTIPPIAVTDTPFMASFSDFSTSGGFDFSTINSIRISLEGPDAYDMVVHEILVSNVVPEASTVVPLAGMFVGVGALLFRRRNAARAGLASV
jgi:hypothetical protein